MVWYDALFPVVAIPIILAVYPSPYDIKKKIVLIFLFFALAKACEAFDEEVYNMLGNIISGHSLKHLLMAVAGIEIVLMTRN